MKIAHVASFRGNIGDQLNHLGFRPWFDKLCGGGSEWVDIEIREVYRGNRNLFEWLTQVSRDVDLIVLGGGNFWELWPENSAAGTSLDLSLEQLKQLGVPCFFNALGIDASQGISKNGRLFSSYLSSLVNDPQFFVTVRNDGAKQALNVHFGNDFGVSELPDHGFFAPSRLMRKNDKSPSGVAVNLARDMPNIRFSRHSLGSTVENLMTAFKELGENVGIEFVPHVAQDLSMALECISIIGDKVARERFSVSRLDTGSTSVLDLFTAYSEAELVVANRFHANVFSIATGANALPLVNYPQIDYLVQGLPIPWPFDLLTQDNFESWGAIIERNFRHPNFAARIEYANAVVTELKNQRTGVEVALMDWLGLNGLLP